MLLNVANLAWQRLHVGKGVVFAFGLLLTGNACVAEPRLPCFLEIAVYDVHGVRLPFKITAVTRVGENQNADLLKLAAKELRLSSDSQRLLHARPNGTDLTIHLRSAGGEQLTTQVVLLECQQRSSVQHGELETGIDIAWSTVTGRVSGCDVSGDWWIRAMPMYGRDPLSDGYVNTMDRSFRVPVGARGGRHILIIGKDRSPAKVLAIDVVAGGKNDIGTVDLSGSCPK